MRVCCIVFDIDGMLFVFCMNFLNIAISNIPTKKKLVLTKNPGGGGGC